MEVSTCAGLRGIPDLSLEVLAVLPGAVDDSSYGKDVSRIGWMHMNISGIHGYGPLNDTSALLLQKRRMVAVFIWNTAPDRLYPCKAINTSLS